MRSSGERDSIPVPATLRNPHHLVVATQRYYSGVRPDEDGRLRPGPHEGVAHLIVSKSALRRALLYLQAILVEAERRGWHIAPSRGYESTGIAIVVRSHAYPISIREMHDRVPMTDADVVRWRKSREWQLRWQTDLEPPALKSVPNGYLKLSSSTWHGGRSTWSEGPRGPLDRKLPQFFGELERRAKDDDCRDAERRREAEERRRRELENLERRRREGLERERAERLVGEIGAWRLASDAREFVAAIREHLGDDAGIDEGTRARIFAGCDWAAEWARTTDPVRNPGRLQGLLIDDDALESQGVDAGRLRR